jgi:hypothetical protein
MTLELLFPPEFIQALLALLAVIVIDLALGVAVAVKLKVFDWQKVADFYTSSVIPNLIGWGAANIVLRLAGTLDVPIITTVANVGIGGLYVLACGSLLASIVNKFNVLQAPVPAPAKTVTVEVTLPTKAEPTPTVEVVPTVTDSGPK